jgi:hypothetical protein
VDLDEAIAIARRDAGVGDATLRSYAAGVDSSVAQAIFGPGSDIARELPSGDPGIMIWGLLFEAGDTWTTVFVYLFGGGLLYVDQSRAPRSPPPAHRSEIVFDAPILNVSNGTTLNVSLLVNDVEVAIVDGGDSATFDPWTVDEPPWTIVARTSRGRELLQFKATPDKIWHSEGDYPLGASGVFGRAELSCGRLDVWAGARPYGPAPGPDFPAGDCDP